MTLIHRVNRFPATHAEAIWNLKETLKDAGWTVTSSGTGTSGTYSASTDLITTPTILAGVRAWFVIREPSGAGGREWCWQRGNNNNEWRVKISPAQGFVGGSPNANTVPSASDQGVIMGGGTDGSPTYDTDIFSTRLFLDPDGIFSFHVIADDTAYGPAGNVVYPFWAFGVARANIPRILICQDALEVGSYPPLVGTRLATVTGDADPAIYACKGPVSEVNNYASYPFFGTFSSVWWNNNATGYPFRYFHSYSSGVNSGFVSPNDILLGDNSPPELSTTPTSAEDTLLPIYLGRQDSPASGFNTPGTFTGLKGCMKGIKRRSISRGTGTTTTSGGNTYVYVDWLLIPWPQGVPSRF